MVGPPEIPALARYRLLFVCMGNICRSPAAEGITRHLAAQRGIDAWIECDSAGTIGYHQGKPPDSRMRAAATRRGIPLGGRSRQVTPQDFSDFDLILAMDRENLADLRALAPDPAACARALPMLAFARENGPRDVPDPYYGGNQGFETVLDLLLDACTGLLDQIETRRTPPY